MALARALSDIQPETLYFSLLQGRLEKGFKSGSAESELGPVRGRITSGRQAVEVKGHELDAAATDRSNAGNVLADYIDRHARVGQPGDRC